MEHNMILSASGWRKVFAESGGGQDATKEIGKENYLLAAYAADSFYAYLKERGAGKNPRIVVATDTRPTGKKIAEAVIKSLASNMAKVLYLGVAAAPEIMAYAKGADAFVYISASHNPIGHNGLKFGLSDGGVLNADENAAVRKIFEDAIQGDYNSEQNQAFLRHIEKTDISHITARQKIQKEKSLAAYRKFSREVISGQSAARAQNAFFAKLDGSLKERKITVCADFNGSARTLCIDKNFFLENGIQFKSINSKPGQIAHEIIPEPENLVHVARLVEETAEKKRAAQKKSAASKNANAATIILGYMPDCDGDRGNIVYWSQKEKRAKILKAQEVFALSVYAELLFCKEQAKGEKLAVAVNCPTSMRIEEIAGLFGAKVFRAEVGEANVVNLAREKREEGYIVRILGEGSNGGTITYPAAVRDPLNTVFALLKLLSSRPDADLDGIIESLPKYSTTGVSEKRAVLKIRTADHALLKKRFQSLFEKSFSADSEGLCKKYGISSWKCALTNGTKERIFAPEKADFSKSGKGGLKILFYGSGAENKGGKSGRGGAKKPEAFIWMRGSGTEPVFRIMCDVKGSDSEKERALLAWETKLLLAADRETSVE